MLPNGTSSAGFNASWPTPNASCANATVSPATGPLYHSYTIFIFLIGLAGSSGILLSYLAPCAMEFPILHFTHTRDGLDFPIGPRSLLLRQHTVLLYIRLIALVPVVVTAHKAVHWL